MSDINLDDLYITHPGVGKSFHVFNRADNRSLCGKFAMIRVDETKIAKVSGDEKYVKGQDCKACFRKAGLAL